MLRTVGVVVLVVVVVVVSGRVDRNYRAERGALGGGGTGLVGPGVVGEPAGGDEVLAGGVGGVHIAPLGPGTVHGHTVSLHNSVGVPEGQAAALTPAVDQGGGGLLIGLLVLHLHRIGGREDGEGSDG